MESYGECSALTLLAICCFLAHTVVYPRPHGNPLRICPRRTLFYPDFVRRRGNADEVCVRTAVAGGIVRTRTACLKLPPNPCVDRVGRTNWRRTREAE